MRGNPATRTSLATRNFTTVLAGILISRAQNKIEILNVAGPRESKEPGVYECTLTTLACFLIGRLFRARNI
jgi:hypothetical protein